MLAGLAEDLDKEVGASVDDARMIFEVRHGIDHAEQLDHALHAGEVTKSVVHDRKQVDAGEPRMLIGLFDADVAADLAGMEMTVSLARPWPDR